MELIDDYDHLYMSFVNNCALYWWPCWICIYSLLVVVIVYIHVNLSIR